MNNNPKILKTQFQINPDITFLNHGSYGACPLPVFENYQKWQELMERDPVKFMTKDVYKHLKISRNELSKFVNCDKDDIVYFPHPTHAVANIISNISIKPGDQVLTTNLEYGSCDRMWFFHANQNQYEYKQSEIKLMEAEALQTKIGEVEKQLMELKLTHAVSPLENPLQIRATRRTLARLKTAFTNKQA